MTDDKVKRRLTTVLCADAHGYSRLMGADEAGTLGTLRRYRTAISGLVERHDGRIVNTWGDAVIAEFASVVEASAVRCALSLQAASKHIGLPIRAGLHTGEIEIRGRDIGGIAVHAAARVMAQSQSDEVLVSRVVTDLVAGAGLKFSERGSHELKGLPGQWDLFAASA
jgi:class 3 adenylate cyclase